MTARQRAAVATLVKPKPAVVYQPVPNLWPGETCVILASGPSLCAEDADYCRGKARVLAVNDAVRLAPWADALWATDGKWWNHHQGVPSFTGLKFGLTVDPVKWPDVHRLRNAGEHGLERDPTGVRTGKNSGYASINLAVHLGVSRILLLGYDMGHAPKQPSHFWGEHPPSLRNNSPYHIFLQMFPTLVEPLKALGITVINCTRGGKLECFPRLPLSEALPFYSGGPPLSDDDREIAAAFHVPEFQP